MLVGHKLLQKNFKALTENGRLAHGYLFFGPEGVGRKLFALSLVNFLEGREFSYSEKENTVFNDSVLVSPNERNAIGIDEARRIKEFLYMKPNISSRRVAIIDQAEFLTMEAENALLKITEEPPESSLLILITYNPEVLMPTINSRLQKVFFSSLKPAEVLDYLTRELSVPKAEAENLARESRGSLGLAIRMFRDEKFRDMKKLADKFLKVSQTDRKDFLKDLLEPEDFKILAFLDMLILTMANGGRGDRGLWHRVLDLRRNLSSFPLNPKLQLMSL